MVFQFDNISRLHYSAAELHLFKLERGREVVRIAWRFAAASATVGEVQVIVDGYVCPAIINLIIVIVVILVLVVAFGCCY